MVKIWSKKNLPFCGRFFLIDIKIIEQACGVFFFGHLHILYKYKDPFPNLKY